MKTIDDYLSLIPVANADKPLFTAAITAALQDIIGSGNVAGTLPSLYDLDSAVGVQLDVVGQWVGFSRQLAVPIAGVYFSLDDPLLGLDQGYLRGPDDPLSGITSLDDGTYRQMLRVKIAANHWDGSLEQAQTIFAELVSSNTGTLLAVIDNFDMSMTLVLAGTIPSGVFIALLKDYPSLVPAAVAVKEVIVTGTDGAPLFGLDIESAYVAGLDVGSLGAIY